MVIVRILLGLVALRMVVTLGWRLASRRWSVPCPTGLAWALDHPALQGILGTARTLGLTIPASLSQRADRVIE